MPLTAQEQYFLELMNRARLDPLKEAARYDIDLNQGVTGTPITSDVKQVLAPNDTLHAAAAGHSDWMLETDTFSHTGAGGSDPGMRMAGAGYVFTGTWSWAENIAWTGTTGTLDMSAAIQSSYDALFRSPGHRVNTLADMSREVGVAQLRGAFTRDGVTYDASMTTVNFASSGNAVFITGVAYTDLDGNGFYDIGEGRGGVTFRISGSGIPTDSAVSEAAGGYAVSAPQNSGPATVTITHGGSTTQVGISTSDGNVKLDLVDDTTLFASGDITLISGPVTRVTLLGAGDIDATGRATADVLTGNTGQNTLRGMDGNDVLRGGGGADHLNGGSGTDTATYTDADAAVRADLRVGSGTLGDAAGDVYLSIENLSGSSFADVLSGDDGANILQAFGGNDVLRGRGGADRLDGGSGIDTVSYTDAPSAVRADLAAGTGTLGHAAGDVLLSIENLNGSNYADLLSGDDGANILQAFDGNDVLRGRGGADRLDGGAGTDTATYTDAAFAIRVNLASGTGTMGDAAGDVLVSIENLNGGNAADILGGDAGANYLQGVGGDDILIGRGGTDILAGGNGADRFAYAATSESAIGLSDRIIDFNRAQGDRIDLSGIDARSDIAGNQAFSFIGFSGYSGTGGEIRTLLASTALIVYADVDGDRQADMSIAVSGITSLTAADFIL